MLFHRGSANGRPDGRKPRGLAQATAAIMSPLVILVAWAMPSPADEVVKQRFVREYPAASAKLIGSLTGVKGSCRLRETNGTAKGEADADFAADHGYVKLIIKLGESKDNPLDMSEMILCGNDDKTFSIKKLKSSSKYVVNSAGANMDTATELDERFRLLLQAPYSAYDTSLMSLIEDPNYVIADASERATDGQHLVTIKFGLKDSPGTRGTVVLNRDRCWSLQHAEFTSADMPGERYLFDVRYGGVRDGVPSIVGADFRCSKRSYSCSFVRLVHERSDPAEFKMTFYNLPDLTDATPVNPGRLSWMVSALCSGVAGFIGLLVVRRHR